MEAAKTICELESTSGDDPTGEFPEPISISSRITIEFTLFYIHVLDRIASHGLSEKDRLQMLGDLVDRTVLAIPSVSGARYSHRSEIKHGGWYFLQFLIRLDEYRQFDRLISEDPSDPTAFHRFGENISSLFGEEQRGSVSMPCQAFVVASLKQIDLTAFVKDMASKQ